MIYCFLLSESLTLICFATQSKYLLTDVVQQPRVGCLFWAPDVVTSEPPPSRRVCWAQVAQNAWHAGSVPPSLRDSPFPQAVYSCPIAFGLKISSSYYDRIPDTTATIPEDDTSKRCCRIQGLTLHGIWPRITSGNDAEANYDRTPTAFWCRQGTSNTSQMTRRMRTCERNLRMSWKR